MNNELGRNNSINSIWTGTVNLNNVKQFNMWRYYFVENSVEVVRKSVLSISPELASLENEYKSEKDDKLIIFFLHSNKYNEYAQTVGRMLAVLLNCKAIGIVGESGSCGPQFNHMILKTFPFDEIRNSMALKELKDNRISVAAYAVITSLPDTGYHYGLENKADFQKLENILQKKNGVYRRPNDIKEYRNLLSSRSKNIASNMIELMHEEKENVGAIIADRELSLKIGDELKEKQVSYIHVLPKAEDRIWYDDTLRLLKLL